MKADIEREFTRYEIARIIGARALQIAMNAPLLIKLSEQELKDLRYDALRISEKELYDGVLPISISRPVPKKRKEKLSTVREEKISDEEILDKEKQLEKEIVEESDELGFTQVDEIEEAPTEAASEEQ